MARNENPPFQRGQTWQMGNTPAVTDAMNLVGKTWLFEDLDYNASMATSGSAKPARTNRYVKCMIVRNTSGGALLPKLIAKMKTDGSGKEFCAEIMGYATTVGELGFPIDEFLPAAGVPANALCWVVVGGPATVTSAAAGDTTIGIGERVIPTTGGKVVEQDDTVAAGAATFAQVNGVIGIAITAVAAINTDFLIDVTSGAHIQ